MARTITDEEIKLSIIINGDPAQKQLFELEKATRKLTEENKAYGIQRAALERQGLKDSQQYKDLTAKIKANTASIDNNKATMKELTNQIGITSLTMAQLQTKALQLRIALRNMTPGSDDFKKFDAELKTVKNRIDELNGKAHQSKSSLSSLADGFNKYAALGTSFVAGLTGIVLSVQKIIDINGKLSDSQADVMKTTKMSKAEVDDLTKSFGLLQTRTSRIDLLKIAEQGGRLGVPKAEIQDFVKSMNVAAVALGDSFTGGVDEVAEKLGKIKFLFKETKDMKIEDAYNAIGSAINDLGADGTASEANIAEFTKRIGSLTDVLKPTVQETLALGTAFEESGIEAETSSRAYNIFMKQASTESAKFAKVMGISKKSIEDMINTNPMNFMLEFSKGLNGMNATEVAKTLDFLGVNADGANKVIGAMGNNFSRFHELINLSNQSFSEGTSLIAEYNVKNENLAATLAKISKKMSGWFSSETFIKYLGGFISWFGRFIGATEDAGGSVSKFRSILFFTAKIIGVVSAAILTNVAWQKLLSMWTNRNVEATWLYIIANKARILSESIAWAGTAALSAITALLTGNITKATTQYKIMTAFMSSTPWGALISLIAGIAVAYTAFSEELEKVNFAQQTVNDLKTETANATYKEKSELESLLKIANDEWQSKKNRIEAIKKINELSPEYLKGLTLENIAAKEGIDIINKYTASLQKMAYTKALAKKMEAIQDEKLKINTMKDTDLVSITDRIKQFIYKGSTEYTNRIASAEKRKTLLAEQAENEKVVQALIDADIKNNTSNYLASDTSTNPKYNIPGDKADGKAETKKDSQAELNQKSLEDERKYQDLLLKNRRMLEDEKIAIMIDGYEKEIALENLRHKREIEDLDLQKIHAEDLAKLDVEINKARADKDDKLENMLLSQKKIWISRNETLDKQIDDIKSNRVVLHHQKIGEIEQKAAEDSFKELKDKYEKKKLEQDTNFNNQLAAAGNNEALKEQLTKEHQRQELENQKEHLIELTNLIRAQMATYGSMGFLDQKGKAKMKDDLNFALNAISKIQAALADLKTPNKRKEIAIGLGGKNDILGFSQKQWDIFFQNIKQGSIGFETLSMAIAVAGATFSEIDKLMTNAEATQLKNYDNAANARKNKLKKQLDSGVINQTQYNKQVEKIDKDLDQKKIEIETAQAKRQRVMAVANIIQSTAQAIIGVWRDVPKVDFGISAGILTGVVSALGALQMAAVLSAPMPGHEMGLYPDEVQRQQDGKMFKAKYGGTTKSGLVNSTSYFLAAENGPEMIIDNKAWTQMDPFIKEALIRDLRGIKGFEKGLYSNNIENNNRSNHSLPTNENQILQSALKIIQENTVVLKEIYNNGIEATVSNRDLKSMKNIKDGIASFNQLRNQSKT